MQVRLLAMLFCLFCHPAAAQDENRLHSFEQKINGAKNDAEKIDVLAELAEYYSVFKLETKADSVLQKALFIAEISSDKELVLKILFNNTITNLNSWSSKETFERSSNFIQKGLQYAQERNRDDYIALAYIRQAGLFRKRHLYNEALQQATQALTALPNSGFDSLRCVLYNEFGDICMANADAIPAYKNYNNAFNIAYKNKNERLQSEIYHRFSQLYRSLSDDDMAKKYLQQSLALDTVSHYTEGEFNDYIELAKITNEHYYIDKAQALAVKLNSDRYLLNTKRLLYYWYMVIGKNSDQTFNYLFSNPDLVQFIKNIGPFNLHWETANIYRYASRYDSAIHYYNITESELTTSNNPGLTMNIYNSMAETYLLNHDSSNAKNYYEKTFSLCRQINAVTLLPVVCGQLGMLYAKDLDFKQAYFYTVQADSANKLLQENAAKDKMVLLQVDQENKKRETDLLEASQKKERKYNLQIMAITVMLTVIFVFMLFIGMFAVSKTTIRLLGYFAFISLFEFIILVLDHPIVTFTHGEPLKIWGIKILLITILVPCQHFMESRMIRFLQSRKLLEARQKFSLKNWWYRLKKPAPVTDAGIEDDTAVL